MEVHNLSLKIPFFQSFKVVTTKDFGIEVDTSAYVIQEFLILKKTERADVEVSLQTSIRTIYISLLDWVLGYSNSQSQQGN